MPASESSSSSFDDRTTTVAELRKLIEKFVAERDWEQFHSPKNLAMSLAIEAAELMEHFQWIDVPQSRALVDDADKMHGIGEELADVISYALAMANALGIDVSDAVGRKMVRNAEKYPADEFRGKYGPKHG
jgi:dCTP diphosphatase